MTNVVNAVKKVEELVMQFQEGNMTVFEQLYNHPAVEKKRESLRDWMLYDSDGDKVPPLKESDVNALLDACLLDAVETFVKGDDFIYSYRVFVSENFSNAIADQSSIALTIWKTVQELPFSIEDIERFASVSSKNAAYAFLVRREIYLYISSPLYNQTATEALQYLLNYSKTLYKRAWCLFLKFNSQGLRAV